MKKLRIILPIFAILILLFGCGYKIVDKSKGNNFKITEILLSGEKRVNYDIKNRLMFEAGNNSSNSIKLDIKTIKIKTIDNKNIKNEITRYELSIRTTITYERLGTINRGRFEIYKSGTYKVSTQRLQTINNEKRLVEILTNNIVKDISSKLNQIVNDS